MTEFSLGDWKEDRVSVLVDGKVVAVIENPNWPGQTQIPQDLLDSIRFGASRLAALRQCRARLGEWVDAGSSDAADHAACVSADAVLRKA